MEYDTMFSGLFALEVLLQYSPLIERLGFDENFIDVSDMIETFPWSEKKDDAPEGYVYGQNEGKLLCFNGINSYNWTNNFLRDIYSLTTKALIHYSIFSFFAGVDNAKPGCNSGYLRHLVVGSHIAAELRHALFEELGITSCAGVAHNKLLAKLVSGANKPTKQTTLFPRHTMAMLNSLESVKKIPG